MNITVNGSNTHKPVLLQEVINGLAIPSDGYIIDCTFGRGGHTKAILEHLGSKGRLLAIDKDWEAVTSPVAMALVNDTRFSIEHSSFSTLYSLAERYGWVRQLSGIVMDLGVSSPQLDNPERGFSFMQSGPLDMRFDNRASLTASAWLASISELELIQVLRNYGEERYARRIARTLISQRVHRPFLTTGELARAIEHAIPTREKGKHPATRSFQAIRIAVNRELSELETALRQAVEVLRPGGRIVVISFHSLEDRIVKHYLRSEEKGEHTDLFGVPLYKEGTARMKRIGKIIRPTNEEISQNPRARSAVLRVAERLP